MSKQLFSLILCLILCTCSLSLSLAEPEKQERVFVTSDAAGHVLSVTDSVKLVNPDAADELRDMSALSNIELTGDTERYTQDGETLTFNAGGKAVHYQGTGSATPPVLPLVEFTLNGNPLDAASLADAKGALSMTVSYNLTGDSPFLAVTAIPVLGSGIDNISVDHGTVFESDARLVIIGYAIPGLSVSSADLDIGSTFTVTADVDHPDIRWMMSVATSDPLSAVSERFTGDVDELSQLLTELEDSMNALHDNKALPDTHDRISEAFMSIRALVDGTEQLADGAKALSDGASSLSDGTVSLYDGSAKLADGTKTFDAGMQKANTGMTSLADGAHSLADGTSQAADGALSLKDGSSELAAGAKQISDGAAALKDGISALDTGLATLSGNNDALNTGADEIFSAILATANTTIAASGLSDAGINLPELTSKNYHDALTTAIDSLSPDGLRTMAETAAREKVAAQVDANKDQIEAAVYDAATAKVLTGVLDAVGIQMPVEDYEKAAAAGKIPEVKHAAIEAAVKAKLSEDSVKAQIAEEVQHQRDILIDQYMAGDDVRKQIEQALADPASAEKAEAARNSLTELLTQLDSVNTFVTGLHSYTDGVAEAAAGSTKLLVGSSALADGTAQLTDGAHSLSDGSAQLADGLAILKTGAGELSGGADTLSTGLGELTTASAQICSGAAALEEGAGKLKDGASELNAGSVKLSDGAAELRDGIRNGINDLYDNVLPTVDGRLDDLVRMFNEVADDLKVPVTYDLLPDGYDHSLLLVIRTDF